jgi:hypothetical protein
MAIRKTISAGSAGTILRTVAAIARTTTGGRTRGKNAPIPRISMVHSGYNISFGIESTRLVAMAVCCQCIYFLSEDNH